MHDALNPNPGSHQKKQQQAESSRSAPLGSRAARLSGTMAPALEVADIFRSHGDAFRQAHAGHLGCAERRVMGAITACQTVLRGHLEQCVSIW
jgi:hypothetical protein